MSLSRFDNLSTLFFKASKDLGVPKDLLFVASVEEWNVKDLLTLIRSDLKNDLRSMWNLINNFHIVPNVSAEEFAVLWKIFHKPYEQIDEEILYFLNIQEIKFEEFYNRLKNEANNLEIKVKNDLLIYEKIIAREQLFEQRNNELLSSFFTPSSLTSNIVLKTNKPVFNIIVDLFNSSVVGSHVPFISYNTGKDYYFKIASFVNNNSILLHPQKMSKEDSIYLRIVKITPENELINYSRLNDEDLHTVVISNKVTKDPSTGKKIYNIHISFKIRDKDINNEVYDYIFREIISSIPSFKEFQIEEVYNTDISGEFFIYGMKLYDQLLLQLLFRHPTVNQSFFVEEKNTPLAFTPDKINLQYRSVPGEDVTIQSYIRKKTLEANKYFFLFNGDKVIVDEPVPLLQITVNCKGNVSDIEGYIESLISLMSIYIDYAPNILIELLSFIPSYINTFDVQEEKLTKIVDVNEIPSIFELVQEEDYEEASEYYILKDIPPLLNSRSKKYAPDLYISSIAKLCQGKNQPLLISDEDKSIWEYYNFEGKKSNQVIGIKKANEDGYYYFVCPNEENKYPGLKNNNLENKTNYPYIVCCYVKDQITNPQSLYNRSQKGTVVVNKQININEDYIFQTSKTGDTRYGNVPVTIRLFFEKYIPNIVRYTGYLGNESVLYAILEGLQEPEYMKLNIHEKKQYVSNLRMAISDFVDSDPALYSGHPFLSDPDEYIDPVLYLPVLEKYFNVRLFMFNYQEVNPHTKEIQNILQIPSYKYFRSETQRNYDRTIILLRNWGSESNILDNPQIELIINRTQEKTTTTIFGRDVINHIESAYSYIIRTYSWKRENNKIVTRINEFNQVNYKLLFGEDNIKSQAIDDYGKTQLLFLRNNMIVGIPASEPLDNIQVQYNMEDITTTYDEAKTLFDVSPDAVTTDINGQVIILWFPLGDIPSSLYIFIVPHPNSENLPEISERTSYTMPNSKVISPYNEYFRNKEFSYLYLYLMKYLFSVYLFLEASGTFRQVKRFLDKYVVIVDKLIVVDIPRIIQFKESVHEIINSLDPMLHYEGRILITQEIYKSIEYSLLQLYDIIKDYSSKELAAYIDYMQVIPNYYTKFINNSEGVIVFNDIETFSDWETTELNQKKLVGIASYMTRQINYDIRDFAQYLSEPFVYYDTGSSLILSSLDPSKDRYYLIQNTTAYSNAFNDAMIIGYNWLTKHENIGKKKLTTVQKKSYVHKLYTLTKIGKLKLVKDNSEGESVYLEILSYPNQSIFAAILPLTSVALKPSGIKKLEIPTQNIPKQSSITNFSPGNILGFASSGIKPLAQQQQQQQSLFMNVQKPLVVEEKEFKLPQIEMPININTQQQQQIQSKRITQPYSHSEIPKSSIFIKGKKQPEEITRYSQDKSINLNIEGPPIPKNIKPTQTIYSKSLQQPFISQTPSSQQFNPSTFQTPIISRPPSSSQQFIQSPSPIISRPPSSSQQFNQSISRSLSQQPSSVPSQPSSVPSQQPIVSRSLSQSSSVPLQPSSVPLQPVSYPVIQQTPQNVPSGQSIRVQNVPSTQNVPSSQSIRGQSVLSNQSVSSFQPIISQRPPLPPPSSVNIPKPPTNLKE